MNEHHPGMPDPQNEAITSPVDKHHQRFEEERDRLTRNCAYIDSQIPVIADRVHNYYQRWRDKFGTEPEPGQFDGPLISAKASLEDNKSRLEFLRPSSDEDMEYRNRLIDDLPGAIRAAAPAEEVLPLRFHGTHIWSGRSIITSGGISSSVDRLGTETSYDVANQVSVAMAKDVRICTEGYTDFEQLNVPPGVLFVMTPGSQEDAKAGGSLLMSNADFHEEPKRLFAIATGSESVEAVKEWAELAGLDKDKVFEYFEFAESLGQLKQQIDDGTVNPQDLVSYPLPGRQA